MWILIVVATVGFSGPSEILAIQEFNTSSACHSAGIAMRSAVQTYELTVRYTCTQD